MRRVIDGAAAVSFVVIVARTALQDVPQILPGGAKIGEVLWQLSLAYFGAWMFHLLVIVIPRGSRISVRFLKYAERCLLTEAVARSLI